MSRNHTELLVHANIAMMEKLNENDHKPSWNKETFKDLLEGVLQETKELEEEMKAECSLEAIRREAADVANYAAMIILRCDTYIKAMDGLEVKSVNV